MRYIASTEIKIRGPQKAANITLPEVEKDAMEDVKVIAYPVPDNGQPVTEKSWKIQKKQGEELTLEMSLGKPAPIRTLIFKTEKPVRIITEGELFVNDGSSWRSLKKIHIDRSNPSLNVGFDPYAPIVISLPETNASDFRFVMSTGHSAGNAEITLSTQPLVERYPEKTLAKMFQTPLPMWDDYLWEKQPEISKDLCVDPQKVIDLTNKVQNGTLSWDIPEGEWIISRTAMRTTGVENAPASPEGRGLEIDKMSKEHIA